MFGSNPEAKVCGVFSPGRGVAAHLPTSAAVAVVTANAGSGPTGVTVGSFTSVLPGRR